MCTTAPRAGLHMKKMGSSIFGCRRQASDTNDATGCFMATCMCFDCFTASEDVHHCALAKGYLAWSEERRPLHYSHYNYDYNY